MNMNFLDSFVKYWHLIIILLVVGLGIHLAKYFPAHDVEDTYNKITIKFSDGSEYYHKSSSCHTVYNFANYERQGLPDGYRLKEGQMGIYDHSATAVGYYGSKGDFTQIEADLQNLGHKVQESHYGHNGNCIIIFKQGDIKEIDI